MTATMRWVIGAVGAVVAAGLAWAVWTANLGADTPAATATPAETAQSLPGSGASPGATPVDGSEVIPPDPQQTDAGQLPPLAQPAPLIAVPLPENATAQGSLVDGFPEAVVGGTASSDVIDSSISSDGATMQAAMNARTDQAPEDVATHYRSLWSGLGLAPVSDDGTQISYADLYSSTTLSVRESGTGTVYTVYATLRTE